MKVLAIDDDEDITYTIKTVLELLDEDYEVITASSGIEGLKLAKKELPEIILLDIMMPEMNGWVVNKKLKIDEKTKNIPVLFLTARTDNLSKKMGLNGGEAFITKPFVSKILDKKIKDLLKWKN